MALLRRGPLANHGVARLLHTDTLIAWDRTQLAALWRPVHTQAIMKCCTAPLVFLTSIWFVGRNSVVRIATRYGLESRRIESRWGRDFPHRPWGSFSNGYRISFRGVNWSRGGVYQPLPSGTEVKEKSELCLYFPSRPSWCAVGRILPCFAFYLAPYLLIISCLPFRAVAFVEDSLPKLSSPTPTFLIRDNLTQRRGIADFSKARCCPYQVCFCLFFFWHDNPPVGHGFLIHEVCRSHTTTHHSW